MKYIYLTIILVELLFIIILLFRIIRYKKNNNIVINNLMEYEKIIDDQGKKNHEYNNQLMILNGYLDDKEKLKEYLDTIIDEHRTGQNYEIRQLSNFPNGGLKSLLYYKINKMHKLGIKYYIYISCNFKTALDNINIKEIKDLSKILGVILDNAIDGAIKSKKKEIDLDFSIDEKYVIMKISNSYNNENVSRIGEKGYTTKGIGHGFGLLIINDIIKRNNKIEVVTDYDENQFTKTIIIDMRKKCRNN